MTKPKPPATDRDAVREILDALVAANWVVHRLVYDDGEVCEEPLTTVDEVMQQVFSVDICYVHSHFVDYGWMMFVLGNDPEEVLADYTVNLEPVVGPLQDKWLGLT